MMKNKSETFGVARTIPKEHLENEEFRNNYLDSYLRRMALGLSEKVLSEIQNGACLCELSPIVSNVETFTDFSMCQTVFRQYLTITRICRCKDCVHLMKENNQCKQFGLYVRDDFYCADGERDDFYCADGEQKDGAE